jgi:hypothetical protein
VAAPAAGAAGCPSRERATRWLPPWDDGPSARPYFTLLSSVNFHIAQLVDAIYFKFHEMMMF